MSFELKLDDRQRAGSRFIARVGKALLLAALDARTDSGVTQQSIAEKLGVNRSVINRWLRGGANLTLRTVGEIAWALGLEIVFELRKRDRSHRNIAPNPQAGLADEPLEIRNNTSNEQTSPYDRLYYRASRPDREQSSGNESCVGGGGDCVCWRRGRAAIWHHLS